MTPEIAAVIAAKLREAADLIDGRAARAETAADRPPAPVAEIYRCWREQNGTEHLALYLPWEQTMGPTLAHFTRVREFK